MPTCPECKHHWESEAAEKKEAAVPTALAGDVRYEGSGVLRYEAATQDQPVTIDRANNLMRGVRAMLAKPVRKDYFYGLKAQQAVASMGTKLSHSDTAIYYSEPVGHLASEQTRDRILTMEKSGVLILHLLVKKTIDEEVRRLLTEKSLQTSTQLERAVRLAAKARLQKEGSHVVENQTMAAALAL